MKYSMETIITMEEIEANITFVVNDLEFIKLQGDGKVFIRGEECPYNQDLYDGMISFLKETGHIK